MKNKLRKKARVQVLRYVQNEQCFKVVPFMKNKLKNCWTTNLDLWIWFHAQQFYTNENFPFKEVIT
jgi:hypothetical protein